MQRKLIKQGLGGYTVYLPKKWLDKKGLKQGDHVEIDELNKDLIITSDVKSKKSISIKINQDNKKDIKNILTHVYRKGFDIIKVEKTDLETEKQIKQIIKKYLLGMDIIKKTEKTIFIENISEPDQEKYSVLLKKIFFIIKEIENLIINYKINSKTDNKELEFLKEQGDKYILFCRRVLIKEKYKKDQVTNWELLTFLMHINHAYYYLCDYMYKNKIQLNNKDIELLKNLKQYFDLYYNAFTKKDITYIHKINSLKNTYHFGKLLTRLEKTKNKKIIVLSMIREIFRLIQIGTSPILSELIEKETNIN